MNKKGIVIGKSISTVVTLIAVTIIMIIFLILSSAITLIKKPEIEQFQGAVRLNSFIFQKTNLGEIDDPGKKLSVLEAITDGTLAQIRYEKLNERLSSGLLNQEERDRIIKERNRVANRMLDVKKAIAKYIDSKRENEICFVLFQENIPAKISGLEGIDMFLVKRDGTTLRSGHWDAANKYRREKLLVDIPLFTATKYNTSHDFVMKAYYGPCDTS